MIICVCAAVNEEEIVDAIRKGASTLFDLQVELGVCSVCESCFDSISNMLNFLRANTRTSLE